MLWVRSFPIPADIEKMWHRSYVADKSDIQFFMTHNYDYQGLENIDDDILLIEWDIALGKEDAEAFEKRARQQPSSVLVAAHRLYHVAPEPVWAHRTLWPAATPAGEPVKESWVRTGDPDCDLFAFGLIYLPRELIRRFAKAPAPERGRAPWIPQGTYGDKRFIDQTFSMWHYKEIKTPVPIDWTVRPVHLHW